MKREKEKGFTLIETIVSVAIFGLVMITAVSMLNVCYMIQKKSNEVTEQENERMDDIEKEGFKLKTGEEIKIQFHGTDIKSVY